MRALIWALIIGFLISISGISYAAESSDDNNNRSTDSTGAALTSALVGGLLGGGLGAAIGSASGHAGTGAAIGAGVGAVGGTLVGASQAKAKKAQEEYSQPEVKRSQELPKGVKVKKRVIRQYDEAGNVVSEEEVKN